MIDRLIDELASRLLLKTTNRSKHARTHINVAMMMNDKERVSVGRCAL